MTPPTVGNCLLVISAAILLEHGELGWGLIDLAGAAILTWKEFKRLGGVW